MSSDKPLKRLHYLTVRFTQLKLGENERILVPTMPVLDTNAAAPAEAFPKTPAQEANRRDAVWDIQEGPKNYAVLVGAQVASALFSFAAVWLATRLLGATGYGGVVAIIAASQAIAQLAVNWSSFSLSRYGVEEFVETGRVAKAFWTRFWIFFPNILLVVATSPLWLAPLASLLKLPSRAFIFVLAHFLANALWIHVQQGLQGAKLMRLQGSLLALERLLILLLIIAVALSGSASFLTVVVAYIFAPLGAATVGIWYIRKLIFPISAPDPALLRRMLAFSLPILPASLVGYMSTNYLDAFFITHYLSVADLGVYAVAYQLAGTALQLPLLVGTLVMPLFVTLQVDDQDDRAVRFMQHVIPLLTLLWGIACSFAAVAGGYLLPLIFGEQFREIERLLWPLLAAAALAGPVFMGYAPFSNAKSVTYIAMVGAIAAAVVNVALDYLLIPAFGLLGCAGATTAAYGINVAVVIFLVHWRLRLDQTWALQAVLPVLAGTAYALIYSVKAPAFLLTLLLSLLGLLLHHKSLNIGFRMLGQFRRAGEGLRC